MNLIASDKSVLQHIKRYCDNIESLIKRFGKDFETFFYDMAYFNAVSMCVLKIGVVSDKISIEYRKDKNCKMPWDRIKEMKSAVIYDYGFLDEELVWNIAVNEIPMILNSCTKELERLNHDCDI